jgi:hypothetical protein
MGENGRLLVRNEFSVASVVARLLQLYAEVRRDPLTLAKATVTGLE